MNKIYIMGNDTELLEVVFLKGKTFQTFFSEGKEKEKLQDLLSKKPILVFFGSFHERKFTILHPKIFECLEKEFYNSEKGEVVGADSILFNNIEAAWIQDNN
ncbi:MAG: hypothetical protein N4A44_04025 [Alphaproteobacteria bacterium]|nr:hypothetical protein [Alphaproteobacteria bacterium]